MASTTIPRPKHERKPNTTRIDWTASLLGAAADLSTIAYGRLTIILFLQQCLTLTPVFWDPHSWLFWLRVSFASAGGPGTFFAQDLSSANTTGYCLDRAAVRDAVYAAPTEVSGWYGPGAFLAWLFSTYVYCVSAIWNQKKSDEVETVEVELLVVLMYPAIAVLDVLYRLIRCRVDPTLSAAMIVVCTSLVTMGATWRLCWRLKVGFWVNIEAWLVPAGARRWIVSVFRILCHALVIGTMGEPWSERRLVTVVYVLGFVNLVFSEVITETKMNVHPYRIEGYRPRHERIGVFVVMQIIYMIVLGVTQRSIFPRSGASLTDLDQWATLGTVVVATIFSKRAHVQDISTRFAGFRRVPEISADSVLP